MYRKANRKSQKWFPSAEMVENLSDLFIHFKFIIRTAAYENILMICAHSEDTDQLAIASDKRSSQINIFFLFLHENICNGD